MQKRLKRPVAITIYALSFLLLVGGIVMLGFAVNSTIPSKYNYVSKGMLDYDTDVKVVNTGDTILKPFNDENVKIVKSYYDYQAEAKTQEESILYYQNTYMQSTGVSYSKGDKFDVLSILSGTVTEVKEDETLGNMITIEHSNKIVSVYQSIGEVSVKKGDAVTQGEKIAVSNTSNISSDLKNHLYFELIINGSCVNPENYYNKLTSDI